VLFLVTLILRLKREEREEDRGTDAIGGGTWDEEWGYNWRERRQLEEGRGEETVMKWGKNMLDV